MDVSSKHLRISRRKITNTSQISAKDERNASFKKIAAILQKPDCKRSPEELELLLSYKDVVHEVKKRLKRRHLVKQRLLEIEDPMEELIVKCRLLAEYIRQSKHLVVYTGAGISTAARIPDYRGTNGIWTRLQQGKDIGTHDLSIADPTYTHMALSSLYHNKILKYIVSQNCDGLHLRSGLPRIALSELHGNMSVEVCKNCKPNREYWRLFDVTENTARYAHKTMRRCYSCNHALVDTIVHFGERGTLQWPLNWSGACKNAKKADTIICLGTSLKVLKKYPWLWQMDKPLKKRPNLCIVNLQWTPKDETATMKINGKCDTVMKLVMAELGIDVSAYNRNTDPIFTHATEINSFETHTKTQPELKNIDSVKTEEEEESVAEADLRRVKSEDGIKKENIKVENISEISKSPIPDSIFAIDNILASNYLPKDDTPPAFHYPYTFPLITSFFNSSNLLYPFQTCFLYSGLHSIINPLPYPVDDTKDPLLLTTETNETPTCDFCYENYKSHSCLYYSKFTPEVLQPQQRYSKSTKGKSRPVYCECCDYSSDSEDDSSTEPSVNENNYQMNANVRIQPGWFGKGYRRKKNRKR